jgi:hypothetical protein
MGPKGPSARHAGLDPGIHGGMSGFQPRIKSGVTFFRRHDVTIALHGTRKF